MELHTIGIDLGKTVFHLVGLNWRGGSRAQKGVSTSTASLHRERASRANRHGSLRWSAFSGPGIARAGA
jgi:O-acetyl-ADP-ribose deacetylase (regulator of RNase III)